MNNLKSPALRMIPVKVGFILTMAFRENYNNVIFPLKIYFEKFRDDGQGTTDYKDKLMVNSGELKKKKACRLTNRSILSDRWSGNVQTHSSQRS